MDNRTLTLIFFTLLLTAVEYLIFEARITKSLKAYSGWKKLYLVSVSLGFIIIVNSVVLVIVNLLTRQIDLLLPLFYFRISLVYILWCFSSWLDGRLDTSSENRFKKDYWNKGKGWYYKWKRDSNGKLIPVKKNIWYYFWFKAPKTVEKFPYSATLFVFLTDGWHLLKTAKKVVKKLPLCLILMLGLYYSAIVFCILTVAEWIGFYLGYTRKKWK